MLSTLFPIPKEAIQQFSDLCDAHYEMCQLTSLYYLTLISNNSGYPQDLTSLLRKRRDELEQQMIEYYSENLNSNDHTEV